MTLSYASGISSTPLLGDTIGANLDKTVAAYPNAMRSSTGRPASAGRTSSSPTTWKRSRLACATSAS